MVALSGSLSARLMKYDFVIQVFTVVLMRMHVFAWDRGKGMNLLYDFMRICLQCLSFSCLQQPGDKIIELIHFRLFFVILWCVVFLLSYYVLYVCYRTMVCCIFVIIICVVCLLSHYGVLYFCYHNMICRIFVLMKCSISTLEIKHVTYGQTNLSHI